MLPMLFNTTLMGFTYDQIGASKLVSQVPQPIDNADLVTTVNRIRGSRWLLSIALIYLQQAWFVECLEDCCNLNLPSLMWRQSLLIPTYSLGQMPLEELSPVLILQILFFYIGSEMCLTSTNGPTALMESDSLSVSPTSVDSITEFLTFFF